MILKRYIQEENAKIVEEILRNSKHPEAKEILNILNLPSFKGE